MAKSAPKTPARKKATRKKATKKAAAKKAKSRKPKGKAQPHADAPKPARAVKGDRDLWPEIQKPTQLVFLTALATGGTVTSACARANIERQTYYNWRKDEKFAKAADHARFTLAGEELLDQAFDMAKHDGPMLRFLLQGVYPARFRPSVQLSNDPDNPLVGVVTLEDGRQTKQGSSDGWPEPKPK